MVGGNGLMRVFWPSDAPSDPNPGVLVGWRNSEYDVLVIAILQDVEVSLLRDNPYRELADATSRAELRTPCKRACSSVTALIRSPASWKDADTSRHKSLGRLTRRWLLQASVPPP